MPTTDAAYTNYLIANDATSQALYQLTKESVERYRFIRSSAALQTLLERAVLLRSGRIVRAVAPIRGLRALRHDVGDQVRLSLQRPVEWAGKNVAITRLTVDLMARSSQVEGLSVGDTLGPVSYSYEATATLYPSVDTYVDSEEGSAAFGSSDSLWHGHDRLTVNEYGEPIGGGLIRACYRFNLGAALPPTATITGAVASFYISYAENASGFKLRQLLSTTWNGSSTWAAFDGSGGWSDAYIGGTSLGPDLLGGPGYKTFSLNSAGLAYLQAQIAGNVELCHAQTNDDEWYMIASVEHATPAFRPSLTITYTV